MANPISASVLLIGMAMMVRLSCGIKELINPKLKSISSMIIINGNASTTTQ